jgi:hypothetical protein
MELSIFSFSTKYFVKMMSWRISCECTLMKNLLNVNIVRLDLKIEIYNINESKDKKFVKEEIWVTHKNLDVLFAKHEASRIRRKSIGKNNFITIRAIISRGLCICYPIFHWGLYFRVVYNAERLIFPGFFI